MCHVSMSSVYACKQLKKETETSTYGHVRPSSFWMLLSHSMTTACGHRLWIGHFHVARASGRLTVCFPYSHTAPRPQCSAVWPLSSCQKITVDKRASTPEVQPRACCSSMRRGGVGTSAVNVKSHIRHVLHHLLAVQRIVQQVGCRRCSPSSLSTCPPPLRAVSRGAGTTVCLVFPRPWLTRQNTLWPRPCSPTSTIMDTSPLVWVAPWRMPQSSASPLDSATICQVPASAHRAAAGGLPRDPVDRPVRVDVRCDVHGFLLPSKLLAWEALMRHLAIRVILAQSHTLG